MKEEDENYINSIKLWLKSQTVLIEQIYISADYNEKMIKSHKKALGLNLKTIDIENKAILDVIDGAKKWCKENNIDENVLTIN